MIATRVGRHDRAAARALAEGENGDGNGRGEHADQRRAGVHPPPLAFELDVERVQRSELARKSFDDELSKAFGAVDVLQSPLAEIANRYARRQIVLYELPSGAGEQDLASVTGGADTSRLVHPETDVVVLTHFGLPGMQPHPHLYFRAFRPGVGGEAALSVNSRRDRVFSPTECRKERVALRVHLPAAVCRERRSQNALVLGTRLRIPWAQLLHELRRAFDVREEERDGAARQLGHRGHGQPRVLRQNRLL